MSETDTERNWPDHDELTKGDELTIEYTSSRSGIPRRVTGTVKKVKPSWHGDAYTVRIGEDGERRDIIAQTSERLVTGATYQGTTDIGSLVAIEKTGTPTDGGRAVPPRCSWCGGPIDGEAYVSVVQYEYDPSGDSYTPDATFARFHSDTHSCYDEAADYGWRN